MFVHNVYFSIIDCTPEKKAKVLADCQKYLTGHPGVMFMAAGTLADVDRPVCDRDWDVGLHIVFENRAAHDAYLIAPRHQQFVTENTPSWKKVRVFDSDIQVGQAPRA